MSTVLLDTTVASLLHPKKKNNTLRAKYEPYTQGQIRLSGIFRKMHQHIVALTVAAYDICGAFTEKTKDPQILALSFQSVAELWLWAEENNWGSKQREGLTIFLQRFLVIPHDGDLAKEWARVVTHCKRIGRRLESGDAWIAATATRYKIPLLTHDRDHVGLNIPDLQVVSHA